MIIDPETYDKMAQNQELLQTLKHISSSNEQHKTGQGKPAKQLLLELINELKTKHPNEN